MAINEPTQRTFGARAVILVFGVGVGLSILIVVGMIIAGSIDLPSCKDGAAGVFIGSSIKLAGC